MPSGVKDPRTDLEALETAWRAALHRAGAAALSELPQYQAPAPDQRQLPCRCGHPAHYQGLRSKPVLTAVGRAQMTRPYYLCTHCHEGHFPADAELDMVDTEVSPGVRRMLATVGAAAPFDHGRQQMKPLAGLEVTTKAVERTAEAIGEDLVARERKEIERALQLDLPMVVGEPVPILYAQMDGTGIPVVKKETVGRLDEYQAEELARYCLPDLMKTDTRIGERARAFQNAIIEERPHAVERLFQEVTSRWVKGEIESPHVESWSRFRERSL